MVLLCLIRLSWIVSFLTNCGCLSAWRRALTIDLRFTRVSRYIARHEYTLTFRPVVSALSHFVNTTLSSLYFDVSKDILYADAATSKRRDGILYVLYSVSPVLFHRYCPETTCQIWQTMSPIVAPLTPYLSEEVHDILNEHALSTPMSFFSGGWRSAVSGLVAR